MKYNTNPSTTTSPTKVISTQHGGSHSSTHGQKRQREQSGEILTGSNKNPKHVRSFSSTTDSGKDLSLFYSNPSTTTLPTKEIPTQQGGFHSKTKGKKRLREQSETIPTYSIKKSKQDFSFSSITDTSDDDNSFSYNTSSTTIPTKENPTQQETSTSSAHGNENTEKFENLSEELKTWINNNVKFEESYDILYTTKLENNKDFIPVNNKLIFKNLLDNLPIDHKLVLLNKQLANTDKYIISTKGVIPPLFIIITKVGSKSYNIKTYKKLMESSGIELIKEYNGKFIISHRKINGNLRFMLSYNVRSIKINVEYFYIIGELSNTKI